MVEKSDEDYINTNILQVKNTGLEITQDIVVNIAVGYLAEKAVKNTIYNLGGKQVLSASTRKLDVKVTKEIMERIAKAANRKLAGSFTSKVSQMFSRSASRTILKSLGKSAASAAAKYGTVAAGGCTLGPVGCAAGAAISAAATIAEISFTIFTTIKDIQDKKGILNLFHKDYVDSIAKDFEELISETYKNEELELGDDFMNEEVLFYPELFIYDFDENGIPYADIDNEWAVKFYNYQNEYLKNIGIDDGWELRLLSGDFEKPDIGLQLPKEKSKVIKFSFVILFIFLMILFSLVFLIVLL